MTAPTVSDATIRHAPKPQSPAYTAPGLGLRRAARIFSAYANARILAALAIGALALRLGFGRWTWSDLIVAAAILALEPFTEWITHTTVLHWKPRRAFGRRLDPLAARKHRAHHRDPKRIDLVLIPLPVLVSSVIVGAGIFWLAAPSWRLALTGMTTSYLMLLSYEWIHFLIHSSYRPRHWYYRYVWRAHRLHHFRNERYWFGVTVHLADHMLRTFPAKDAVPASPTALTLGIDAA